MDVTVEADVLRLVQHAHATFGALDIVICNAGFGYYGTRRGDAARDHAPHDGRQLHRHLLRRPRGAADLPAAGARASHLRLVHRRPPRHSADGRLQRNQGRAGRASPSRCGPSSRAPTSTSAPSIPCRPRPSSGRRWSATTGTPCPGSGPKQPVEQVAAAVVRCIRRPRAEVYPHAKSRALAVLNVVAPGFTDRLVQKYGRRRDTSGAGRASRR